METMNIGIDPLHRAEIAQGLKHLLADTDRMRIHEKTAWMLRAMQQAA